MSSHQTGLNSDTLKPSRIYKSRRTFFIPEILYLSIILYCAHVGYSSGNISGGLTIGMIGFGVVFAFFIWWLTRSLGLSIALQQDRILYKRDFQEWKSILFSEIHSVEFYSIIRKRFMKVTAGPFYQETGFLIGGLHGLDEFKAELKEKLGDTVREKDRWWNKASHILP